MYNIAGAKIGLLGGTFDPPHYAHIHMAQAAKDALGLDFVVFMPLGVPPHGKDGISKAHHRVAMLELMIADHDGFYIDNYEVLSNEPSYTVRTIERINSLLEKDTRMYFIIGADSLMYLEKWRNAERLLKITEFAVIPRTGFSDKECKEHIKMLVHEFGAQIRYLDAEKMNYSSTDIRNSIAKGDNKTSPAVMKYIKENGLYS